MSTMPSPDEISEIQERILLGLWKLMGIGENLIDEETLRRQIPGSRFGAVETGVVFQQFTRVHSFKCPVLCGSRPHSLREYTCLYVALTGLA